MRNFLKNINSIKNSAKGEAVFILGNGPSILNHDLSRLKERTVIGMNASTILEKRFCFTQTYHTISDNRFLCHPEKRKWGTTELHPDTIRVLRREARDIDEPELENRTFYVRSLGRDGFSHNLRSGFFFGSSTTMLAIQLAAHIGAKDIFLLGVDLRYSPENPRFYAESSPQIEDAFTSVQIMNIANASMQLEKAGKRIFNCSHKSFLRPYLPFMEFDKASMDGWQH